MIAEWVAWAGAVVWHGCLVVLCAGFAILMISLAVAVIFS
jgi:hypothetical protein